MYRSAGRSRGRDVKGHRHTWRHSVLVCMPLTPREAPCDAPPPFCSGPASHSGGVEPVLVASLERVRVGGDAEAKAETPLRDALLGLRKGYGSPQGSALQTVRGCPGGMKQTKQSSPFLRSSASVPSQAERSFSSRRRARRPRLCPSRTSSPRGPTPSTLVRGWLSWADTRRSRSDTRGPACAC